MVSLITLFKDGSFKEKRVKVEEDKLKLSKEQTPKYTPLSVFKECNFPLWQRFLMFWKRKRTLLIYLDGAPKTYELDTSQDETRLIPNFGTLDDEIKFLKKVTLKSVADRKPITNMQFFVICALLIGVMMLVFMDMKGITF